MQTAAVAMMRQNVADAWPWPGLFNPRCHASATWLGHAWAYGKGDIGQGWGLAQLIWLHVGSAIVEYCLHSSPAEYGATPPACLVMLSVLASTCV